MSNQSREDAPNHTTGDYLDKHPELIDTIRDRPQNLLVTITYAAVLFSVIGQGLTMERLIRRNDSSDDYIRNV